MLKKIKNLFKLNEQAPNAHSNANNLLKNREDRFHVDQHLHFFKVWFNNQELSIVNISATGLAIKNDQFELTQKLTLQIEIDDLVFNEDCEVVRIQNGVTAFRLLNRSDRYHVLFHRFFAIEKRAHDLSLIHEKLFQNDIDVANSFWCRNSSGDELFFELNGQEIVQLHLRVQNIGLQKNKGSYVQFGQFEKHDENRAYGQWVLGQSSLNKRNLQTQFVRFVDNIELLEDSKKQLIIAYILQI